MYGRLAHRAFKLMAAAPIDGCLVEFGVYRGDGLLTMARLARRYLAPPPLMYGFDSFTGMPPTEVPLRSILRQGWAEGVCSDTSVELVQDRLRAHGVSARLIKGMFGELAPLREYGIEQVRFAVIDCDLYEGFRDALRLLTPHVRVGTVLMFDDLIPPTDHRHQSVREHGKRAVEEWEHAVGMNLHLIRIDAPMALCVLVDEAYLERYARAILPLKRDQWGDLATSYARQYLGDGGLAPLKRVRDSLRGLVRRY